MGQAGQGSTCSTLSRLLGCVHKEVQQCSASAGIVRGCVHTLSPPLPAASHSSPRFVEARGCTCTELLPSSLYAILPVEALIRLKGAA